MAQFHTLYNAIVVQSGPPDIGPALPSRMAEFAHPHDPEDCRS